ncbi:MAG: hypothetical protein AB1767_12925 [Bacillota bacterium]
MDHFIRGFVTGGVVMPNQVGGIIWSLVTAYTLKRLDHIPERAG